MSCSGHAPDLCMSSMLWDRLKVLLAQDASSVDELCQQQPADMETLAISLAEQAEAIAHRQLEQQQQEQKPSKVQQQELQLQLTQCLTGLVKLLCCSSQQVHCAVVTQLARLAYCTPVLEQVDFPLDKHPTAVASVVNLLRGLMWEPNSTSEDSAATGPPPTLQAEAAAALLVLSSLGKGSKQLVGQHPGAIRGLAEVISDPPVEEYCTAATPGARAIAPGRAAAASSQQQQQQPSGGSTWSTLKATGRKLLGSPWVVAGLCVSFLLYLGMVVSCGAHMCNSAAGTANAKHSQGACWLLCVAVAPSHLVLHMQYLWQECRGMVGTLLWLLAPTLLQFAVLYWGVWAPGSRMQAHHDLQQQWAAYCAHYLLVDSRATINSIKKDVRALAALERAMHHCRAPGTKALLCSVLSAVGVHAQRPADEPDVPEGLEPPPPPASICSWRAALDRASLRLVKAAAGIAPYTFWALYVAFVLLVWQVLQHGLSTVVNKGFREMLVLQTAFAWGTGVVLCQVLWYVCCVWACAAAVVLTLTSDPALQPRVAPFPGAEWRGSEAWPLHTLACDLADLEGVEDPGLLVQQFLRDTAEELYGVGPRTAFVAGVQRRQWLTLLRSLSSSSSEMPLQLGGLVALAALLGWHLPGSTIFPNTVAWLLVTGMRYLVPAVVCTALVHLAVLHGVLLPLLSHHAVVRTHMLHVASAYSSGGLSAAAAVLRPLSWGATRVCCTGVVGGMVAGLTQVASHVLTMLGAAKLVVYSVCVRAGSSIQGTARAVTAGGTSNQGAAAVRPQETRSGRLSVETPQQRQQRGTGRSKSAAGGGKSKPSQTRSSKQTTTAGAPRRSSSSSNSNNVTRAPSPGASAPPDPPRTPRAEPAASSSSSKQAAPAVYEPVTSTSTPEAASSAAAATSSARATPPAMPRSSSMGSTKSTTQQQQTQVAVPDASNVQPRQQQRQQQAEQQAEQQQQQQQPEPPPGEVPHQQGGSQPASPSAAGLVATTSSSVQGVGDDSVGAVSISAPASALPASGQAAGPGVVPVAVTEQYQHQVLSPSSSSASGTTQAAPGPLQATALPTTASSGLYLVQLVAAKRAAMAAATTAAQAAAGQPLHVVHASAAKAAAAAVEAVGGMPFVTASSIVAEAAAAALGLLQEAPAPAGSIGNSSVRQSDLASSSQGRPGRIASTAATRRQQECVVCLDAQFCVRTDPCGHQVLCWRCAEKVASSKGKGECPMCRVAVEQYVVVAQAVQG